MTTEEYAALLKLALNGTALELLACIEAQSERVGNGFLEAERYPLGKALDSIDAYLACPDERGSLVLASR
jgi:hypothetical protein